MALRPLIADVPEVRGELDEALRIRREEELPVFECLGDVRERAMTSAESPTCCKTAASSKRRGRLSLDEGTPRGAVAAVGDGQLLAGFEHLVRSL
jgi:hypothetical protein